MGVSIADQLIQYLIASAVGISIGLFYKVFIKLNRYVSLLICDIIFTTITVSLCMVYFMTICSGYVRIYHAAGLVSGAVAVRFASARLKLRRKSK